SPPGRRDALRRDHGPAVGSGTRDRARRRRLGALRAGDLNTRLLRGRAPPASRVLPRPRPDRADAVRRRARARGRPGAARPLACGQRARAEAPGGGAMVRLIARTLKNVQDGRMQRLLAAATAFSAPPLAFEIY